MSVYFIRAGRGGPVKIGHAKEPRSRLIELQVAHYEALQLYRMFEGGRPEEQAVQRRFLHLRIRGDWFRFSTELLGDVGLKEIEVPPTRRMLRGVAHNGYPRPEGRQKRQPRPVPAEVSAP